MIRGLTMLVLAGCGARSWDAEPLDEGEIGGSTADAGETSDAPAMELDDADGGDVLGESDDAGAEQGPGTGVAGVCSLEFGCPCGLVGRITTTPSDVGHAFEWVLHLGERRFGEGDAFTLWFSALPPDHGRFVVSVDDVDGVTPLEVDLREALDAEFDPGGWNRYRIAFRFDTGELEISVGNRDQPGVPFRIDSLHALRFVLEDAVEPASAWVESIRMSFGVWGDEELLYEQSFDAAGAFDLDSGTLEVVEQPAGSSLPAGCS